MKKNILCFFENKIEQKWYFKIDVKLLKYLLTHEISID